MGINIGNNNKINKSNITNNSQIKGEYNKKTFFVRHPLLSTIIGTIIAGIVVGLVLMFSYWESFIASFERIWGG